MNNKKGFYLINIIIIISIFLIIFNFGYFVIKDFNEKRDLETAKIEIFENINNLGYKAFLTSKTYYITFDYSKKIIIIKNYRKIIQIIKLPKRLKYVSLYDNEHKKAIKAKITKNGNINKAFSIYIFDSKGLARYRISFYSFDIIKYLKINVYKNMSDKSAKYNSIISYHKNWEKKKVLWKKE